MTMYLPFTRFTRYPNFGKRKIRIVDRVVNTFLSDLWLSPRVFTFMSTDFPHLPKLKFVISLQKNASRLLYILKCYKSDFKRRVSFKLNYTHDRQQAIYYEQKDSFNYFHQSFLNFSSTVSQFYTNIVTHIRNVTPRRIFLATE